MKRIDENQLAARVAGLREKIAEIESQQNEGVWDAIKGAGQKVAGWMGQHPMATAGGAAAAGAAGTAAAMGAGGKPAPTAPKSDPAVMKQQQDLIAKGAKIKADGIMGPATQAAIKQFGGAGPAPTGTTAPAATPAPSAPAGDAAKNPVGTTNASTAIPTGGLENPANQAKPTPAPAAAPAGAPANVTAQGSEFGTDATFAKPDAAPAAAPAKSEAEKADDAQYAAANAQNQANAVKATQTMPAGPAPMGEGTGFRNDELSRIVSLVHYR